MNKDTISGSIKEAGGKMRSKVGDAVGDKKGEAYGLKDQAAGKVQKNYGKIKDAVS
jgi:uncharacterized protein YjbJ (UPF0337 family)